MRSSGTSRARKVFFVGVWKLFGFGRKTWKPYLEALDKAQPSKWVMSFDGPATFFVDGIEVSQPLAVEALLVDG